MKKTVRNTVFTVLALILTGVSLYWNHTALDNRQPLALEQLAVASQNQPAQIASDLPLTLTLGAPVIRLGDTQKITVITLPNVPIDLKVQYPDGTTDHPQTQTAKADAAGRFQLSFKLDNYQYLGVFTVTVTVTMNHSTSTAQKLFTLDTWGSSTSDQNSSNNIFPLVP